MASRKFKTAKSEIRLSGPEMVHAAVSAAHSFAGKAALDDASGARLSILVEELVSNLDEHAALPPGAEVHMALASDAMSVSLVLTDGGSFFDPRNALPKGNGGRIEGGAGLALVHAWAEVVSYRRSDGVNRLEIRLKPVEG